MGTTTSETSAVAFDTPVPTGLVLGVLLGITERFLLAFDLATLGVGLLVVGIVLASFGERRWSAIGRALATAGISGILALQLLSVVF